jgi:hypothetical protein
MRFCDIFPHFLPKKFAKTTKMHYFYLHVEVVYPAAMFNAAWHAFCGVVVWMANARLTC